MNPILFIKLKRLVRRLGISTTVSSIEDVLSVAHLLTDSDLKVLADIACRLPEETIVRLSKHRDFGLVLEKFIELTGIPRPAALVSLKTGIPIRSFVLPEQARKSIELKIVKQDGTIYIYEGKYGRAEVLDTGHFSLSNYLRLSRWIKDESCQLRSNSVG